VLVLSSQRRARLAQGMCVVPMLLTLVLAHGPAHARERAKLLPAFVGACIEDFLASPSRARTLAILNVTLDSVCGCVATQTISQMSESDFVFMEQNGAQFNEQTKAAWLSSNRLCLAVLAK
jgi:hypothetical protein